MGKEDLQFSEQEIIDLGWEKLDKALDAREPKRPKFIWWLFPILLLIGGSITFFTLSKTNSTPKVELAKEKTAPLLNAEEISSSSQNQKEETITPNLEENIGSSERSRPVIEKSTPKKLTPSKAQKNSLQPKYSIPKKESIPTTSLNAAPNLSGKKEVKARPKAIERSSNAIGIQMEKPILEIEKKNTNQKSELEKELLPQEKKSPKPTETKQESKRPRVSVSNEGQNQGSEKEIVSSSKDTFNNSDEWDVNEMISTQKEQNTGELQEEELEADTDSIAQVAEEMTPDLKLENKKASAVLGELNLLTNSFNDYGLGVGLSYERSLGEKSTWAIGFKISSVGSTFEESVNYQRLINDSLTMFTNGLEQRINIVELAAPITYQYKLSPSSEVSLGIAPAYQRISETRDFTAENVQALDINGNPVTTPLFIPISNILPDNQFTLGSRVGYNFNLSEQLSLSGNLTKTLTSGNETLNYQPTQLGIGVRFKF